MNTDAPTTIECPQCSSTNGVAMSEGSRLCLECRHEWNPADDLPSRAITAPPAGEGETTTSDDGSDEHAAPAVSSSPEPDELAGPIDAEQAAEAAQAALDALIGTDVILEGGQLARIAGFPDDDHAEVLIAPDTDDERLELVALDDVVRSVEAPLPVADVPDDTAAALARVNMAVAGLVIRAGLTAVAGEYPNAELLTPATGWLPLDTDGLPAIEQGAAYAVAFLIHAFSLDRETVGAIADTLLTDAQSETTTKGESNASDTSGSDRTGTEPELDADDAADVHGVDDSGDQEESVVRG